MSADTKPPMGIGTMLLRWLGVPIAIAAITLGCVVLGRWVVSLADARCATENLIGGACVEPWHTAMVEYTIYGSVICGALAIAVIPALIAPKLQRATSITAWLLTAGALSYAFISTGWQDLLPLVFAGALAGLIGVAWIWVSKRPSRSSHEAA